MEIDGMDGDGDGLDYEWVKIVEGVEEGSEKGG